MKSNIIIFIFVIVLPILCKNNANDQNTIKNSQLNIVGVSDNVGKEPIVAVTYAQAKPSSFLPNSIISTYKAPELVQRLPDIITPPVPGQQVSAVEIPSETTYYDGSMNLNVGTINCAILIQSDCFKQSSCGWCGQTRSCIRGTVASPVENCAGSYTFTGNIAGMYLQRN